MSEEPLTPPAADNTAGAEQDKPLMTPEVPAEGSPQTGTPQPAEGDAPLIDPGAEPEEAKDTGAPETYGDFTMPEGYTLEGDEKETVHNLFRDLDLSQEKAQKLVDYFTKRTVDDQARMLEELSTRRKGWRAEVRNRPDFATESGHVKRALAKFLVEPDEKELFNNSWLSDHPVFWKVFSRIGAQLGEDAPLTRGGNGESGDSAVKRFPVNL